MAMHLDTLRQHLLNAPDDHNAWAELARALLLEDNTEVAAFAQQFAAAAPIDAQEQEQSSPSPPLAITASSADDNPDPSISVDRPPPLNLEQVAREAAIRLEQSGLEHLVLSVAAGTITIAARQSSSSNACLLLGDERTHVQTREQLIYRDPATGVRIACLTLQPIRLTAASPQPLQAYGFAYGHQRGPLSEAMPGLQTPLQIHLEGWDGMRLRGWMAFAGGDLIARVPALMAMVDGVPVQMIEPTEVRLDVMAALQKPFKLPCGFQLHGLRRLIRRQSSRFELCDPITHDVYGSFILNRSRTFHEQILQVSKGFCGFGCQERDGEVVVTTMPRHQEHQPVPIVKHHKLDILVPVYKNWALTRQCLEALTSAVGRARSANPHREVYVHATNDCSPDDAVNENLPHLCEQLGVILHVNGENLGFIRTVNNFMNNTSGDVLLVNSDVIVSNGCIHQLISAREALGAEVATLTAFSNNATIFSYPWQVAENPVSSLDAIERIADAFARCAGDGASTTQQVPVSHGFLMYISRTAIKAVGVFDEYFGLGYGEEVDWAMRAATMGFEHHLCTSSYAFHKGSVSFGATTRLQAVQNSNRIISERYPFYDKMVEEFIHLDELRQIRNRVGLELLHASPRPLRLHVTHASGGGVDKYIEGLAEENPDVQHVLLRPGRTYADLASGQAAAKLFNFSLECSDLDAVILGDLRTTVAPAIQSLKEQITGLTLHSFVGWKADEIECLMELSRECGLAYDLVGHDYMTLCPRIKLIDSTGTFCEVGDASRCSHCLRTADPSVESSLLAPYTSDIELYRGFFASILRGATEIRCSTLEQADRFARQGFSNLVIREPFEPSYSLLPGVQHDSGSRNIVLIGGVSVEKGAERLFQVASLSLHINPSVHFYLIGAASNHDKLITLPNYTHLGSYRSFNGLHDLVRNLHSPIAFFPAIWPETWCYTLSEAMLMGLPIIAPNLGALGSRLNGIDSPLIQLYSPQLSDQQLAELVCAGVLTA